MLCDHENLFLSKSSTGTEQAGKGDKEMARRRVDSCAGPLVSVRPQPVIGMGQLGRLDPVLWVGGGGWPLLGRMSASQPSGPCPHGATLRHKEWSLGSDILRLEYELIHPTNSYLVVTLQFPYMPGSEEMESLPS